MNRTVHSVIILAAIALAAAGCSNRDQPVTTPVSAGVTPTYRSSANSTDQPNTPFYVKAGANPGKRVQLPAIASQAGFDENSPIASQVVAALAAQHIDTRYLAASANKAGVVRFDGTVASAAIKAKAQAAALGVKGVTGMADELTVNKP